MDINLADLPDNVETLQRMVRTLASERANLTEAQAEIERLRLIVQKLQRSQFGRRAERLDDDQLQFGFEDLHADIARVEATLPSTTVKMPRSRRANAGLFLLPVCTDRPNPERSARPTDSSKAVPEWSTDSSARQRRCWASVPPGGDYICRTYRRSHIRTH